MVARLRDADLLVGQVAKVKISQIARAAHRCAHAEAAARRASDYCWQRSFTKVRRLSFRAEHELACSVARLVCRPISSRDPLAHALPARGMAPELVGVHLPASSLI